MPAILNNLKNVTHFVSEIYYASIFLPQKDKHTHKVAFQNTPRNPSGNMNYRKQIFFNCYYKSPSFQLFFGLYFNFSCQLGFLFLINRFWKLYLNYSDYALFDECVFCSLLLCLVLISTSLVASVMQDVGCHTLWSVQGSSCTVSFLARGPCRVIYWRRQLTISLF